MAMKHSLLKVAVFFTILLTATAVDLSGNSKMSKAMALYGGLPLSISMMRLLVPNDFAMTCHVACRSNSDCAGAWLCHWCWPHENPTWGYTEYWCSMLPD
ncbi:hypothetical protein FXO38_27981 [Capsicum annuum]|uniref:Carboxypeptidase A inhibitor-like domain-containing protein n=1 Tax=Capsicum annuum TaxID=4072 RepID=A0A1U8F8P2_CAPAN|nr:fruit-specific protein [Capsicum annuum]KAF3628890.1 hypothetical protein FXO38_27981 [Capsicum annuum]PHT93644.1 hypothetical protein T459_01526 [Capsicum annuum]